MPPPTSRFRRFLATALPYLLAAVAVDAWFVVRTLQATGGELCPVLDDAYIYFQYGRSVVELHPLAYHRGDVPTTGATSLLYTFIVGAGQAVGLTGNTAVNVFAHAVAVVFFAWMLATARALGDRMVGAPGGLFAAGAVLACPQLAFLSMGGMDVAVVAAVHLACLAAAVRWITARDEDEPARVRGAVGLAALAAIAGLARPEAASASAAVALALVVRPAAGHRWSRALAVAALAPAFFPAALAWATTGSTSTTGQLLKWLPSIPNLSDTVLRDKLAANRSAFAEFLGAGPDPGLPAGFHWLLGTAAVVVTVTVLRRYGGRGALALVAFGGAAAVVVTPMTFFHLGQLDRYVVQYIAPLLVVAGAGVAVLARLAARARPLRFVPMLTGLGLMAWLLTRAPDTLDELMGAVTDIHGQHLVMAEHVAALPPDAVVALNDAGAIAYLGGHRTYDMVGLTTVHAIHDWWAGDGATWERLERLPPERRPTHVAFYPGWFPSLAASGVLGDALAVVDLGDRWSGIASVPVKELRPVRTALYGTGAMPTVDVAGELVDELDVADLVSEKAHEYRLTDVYIKNAILEVNNRNDRWIADGGRRLRPSDSFVLRGDGGRAARWVSRLRATATARVSLKWNGAEIASRKLTPEEGLVDLVFPVPTNLMKAGNVIERSVVPGFAVNAFHEWLYQ